MDTRDKGRRLASGITAAVSIGSLAAAGVAAVVVYSATPSVASKTSPAGAGSDSSGHSSRHSPGGGTLNDGTSGPRGVTPVQPGNGGITHGHSSGS